VSLKNWADSGWLQVHQTTPAEIAELLAVAERGVKDARIEELSPDARVGLGYQAALAVAGAALAAAGYRATRERHHERVIDSLLHTMRVESGVVRELHRWRRARNTMTYERMGNVSAAQAGKFVEFVQELRSGVTAWLAVAHPDLTRTD
jgi:hypothetical protein